MRISRLLVAAAFAFLILAPIGPADATTISPGELMYTDLFLWPNWREILAQYDCTPGLTFYLWNAPSPAAPVTIAPSPATDPPVAASSANSPEGVDPLDPIGIPSLGAATSVSLVDPIGTPSGDVPGATLAVPELSTWAMLLLGFAGLSSAGLRHGEGSRASYLLRTKWVSRPASGFARHSDDPSWRTN